MSKHTLFLSAVLFMLGCCAADCGNVFGQDLPEPTTFYVVRHADRDGENDALTTAGHERARQLSQLMQFLRISEIYSTDTTRTKNTAQPTAELLELTVQPYGNLTPEWFERLKQDHVGEAVLIVGHSNTSGQIVAGLGGEGDFVIEENEYDSLFVVTVDAEGTKAIRLQFGAPNEESEVVPEDRDDGNGG